MEKKDKLKIEPKKLIVKSNNKQSRNKMRDSLMEEAKILSENGDQIAYINFTSDGELLHFSSPPGMPGLLANYHEFESQTNLPVLKHQTEQREDQAPKQSNESTSSRQLLAGDISDVGSEKELPLNRELRNAPSTLQDKEMRILQHQLEVAAKQRELMLENERLTKQQKELMLEKERLTKQVEDLKRSSNTSEHTQPQQVPVAEDITEKQGTSSSNNEVNLDLKLGSSS